MQRPRCSMKAPKTRRSSWSMMKSRSAMRRACCTDVPRSEALQDFVGAALHVGQRALHRLGTGVGRGSLLADDELDGRLAPHVLGQRLAHAGDLGDVAEMGQLLPLGAGDDG